MTPLDVLKRFAALNMIGWKDFSAKHGVGASDRVLLRGEACWICHEKYKFSYPEIGRSFGRRDHSSVIHLVQKYEAAVAAGEYLDRISELMPKLPRIYSFDEVVAAVCRWYKCSIDDFKNVNLRRLRKARAEAMVIGVVVTKMPIGEMGVALGHKNRGMSTKTFLAADPADYTRHFLAGTDPDIPPSKNSPEAIAARKAAYWQKIRQDPDRMKAVIEGQRRARRARLARKLAEQQRQIESESQRNVITLKDDPRYRQFKGMQRNRFLVHAQPGGIGQPLTLNQRQGN